MHEGAHAYTLWVDLQLWLKSLPYSPSKFVIVAVMWHCIDHKIVSFIAEILLA